MLHPQHNQNQMTQNRDREALKPGKSLQGLFRIGSRKYLAPVALALTALLGTSAPVQALSIKFDYESGTSLEVRKGFEMAANIWEGLLADDTTLNIEVSMVDFASEFGDGTNGTEDYSDILGLALPTFWDITDGVADDGSTIDEFDVFKNALAADSLSADDTTAVNNLTISDNVKNNYDMILTQANAKALGLYTGSTTAYDGQVRINSGFSWDMDITPDTGSTGTDEFYYLSVALHEIAHILGFTSGIDSNGWVTANSEGSTSPTGSAALDQATALDMFRFDDNNQMNLSQVTDSTTKRYFSLDGGTNDLAEFSTGVNGDGYQASHWKNDKWVDENGNLVVNEMIGIMDPAFGKGERGEISALDLKAFDAIGWNRTVDNWDSLDMAALANQASTDATLSVFQDILEQFQAEQGLAWWWFRFWWGGWWNVDEDAMLADAGYVSEDRSDELNVDSILAATVDSLNPNSLPPAASVPEPGTIAGLMGVGLLGLSSRRKGRESKSSN